MLSSFGVSDALILIGVGFFDYGVWTLGGPIVFLAIGIQLVWAGVKHGRNSTTI